MKKMFLVFSLFFSCNQAKEILHSPIETAGDQFPFGFMTGKIIVNKPTNILLCVEEIDKSPVTLVMDDVVPLGTMDTANGCYHLNSVVFNTVGAKKLHAFVSGQKYLTNITVLENHKIPH